MSTDERRGDAITAPPEPATSSLHKINLVESGDDCNTFQKTLSPGKISTPC